MSTVQTEHVPITPPAGGPVARPNRRAGVVLAILALLLGAAGGYLLRWGTEQTKTVTKTVTKTATAPAYMSGAKGTATVSFDGTTALYSGPAELKTGVQLTIRYISAGSLVISRLDPAPTWGQLTHDIATANTSTSVEPLAYVHNVAGRDGPGNVVATLTTAGLYSVWAGPVTGPAGGPTVALATVLRVTP